jgi:hypothetical protein
MEFGDVTRPPDKGDEDLGNVVRAAVRNILADPAAASCKRVAWAYGCCRAGSEAEGILLVLLRDKLAIEAAPASAISTASNSSAATSSVSTSARSTKA